MNHGKILVILSSAQQLELADGVVMPTGFFLNELGVPALKLARAGYELVLANPRGNTPRMDTNSDDPSFFGNDKRWHQEVKTYVSHMPHPKTFAQVLSEGMDDYLGIFVPGGHAPMADLIADVQLGQILRHFHQRGKPTALVCHGPAALLSAQNDPIAFRAGQQTGRDVPAQDFAYAGYKMTCFSNVEEKLAELKMPAKMQFYLESALRDAGAKLDVAWIPMQSKVVVDRELITGQNPKSDDEFSQHFLTLLARVPSRR